MIVALDPGKNLGLAYVREGGGLERAAIITLSELAELELPEGATVVIGDGTGSGAIQKVLKRRGIRFAVVDETGTSLAARALYFNDQPPRGLMRLLPPGMRWPPRPIDDYAAYAIALRYLQQT